MKANEEMLVVLRHQRDLMGVLLSEFESRGDFTIEDYLYCEHQLSQMIQGLKRAQHFVTDETRQGTSWFQRSRSFNSRSFLNADF